MALAEVGGDSSDSTPSLGTSISRGSGSRKRQKDKKKKKKKKALKNPQKGIRINEFSKVAGYKIDMQLYFYTPAVSNSSNNSIKFNKFNQRSVKAS